MATTSTVAVLTAVQVRLMQFQPLDGSDPINRRLSGGLNLMTVPDSASEPYGALRLVNRVRSNRYQMERVACECECLWFHAPRSKARELEAIADVAEQAMTRWKDASGGAVVCTADRRDTLPPVQTVEDAERVKVRQLFSLVIWPSYLTQYASADVPA